ncbi:MAG: sirohydrochlorin cobaltochelatase [Acidobacteria bacterium]|nr:sirohydrochlorin cobaltochelatase [Acidobacteriota bacterium]MCI0724119.1 sirohydrochlorin cobaltochelatase [Acidobacteriota bacterium]
MKKQALLIIDHGSIRDDANELLPKVARMLKEMSDFEIVCYAHMELAEPTIQQGFDACIARGAEEVIVHPYFLGPGRHSVSDIPHMVAQAAARHSGISYRITEPLGLDAKIVGLILERVRESLR